MIKKEFVPGGAILLGSVFPRVWQGMKTGM